MNWGQINSFRLHDYGLLADQFQQVDISMGKWKLRVFVWRVLSWSVQLYMEKRNLSTLVHLWLHVC